MAEKDEKPNEKPAENVEVDELADPNVEADNAPLLEPEGAPDPVAPKVHPLAPGGKRFEQVYAKGKQAEREVEELKIQLAELRGQVGALRGSNTQVNEDPEYTWDQLEGFIAQGRITRADAEAHRESIRTKKLKAELKAELETETKTVTRSQSLASNIQAYLDAVPAILVEGSEERQRLDDEFDTIAAIQGVDPAKLSDTQKKALQLTALRTVFGSVTSASTKPVQATPKPHEGLPGGTKPKPNANPDQAILDKLTKREVEHYKKMFRANRYPNGWKDVVAEIKYERKRGK